MKRARTTAATISNDKQNVIASNDCDDADASGRYGSLSSYVEAMVVSVPWLEGGWSLVGGEPNRKQC